MSWLSGCLPPLPLGTPRYYAHTLFLRLSPLPLFSLFSLSLSSFNLTHTLSHAVSRRHGMRIACRLCHLGFPWHHPLQPATRPSQGYTHYATHTQTQRSTHTQQRERDPTHIRTRYTYNTHAHIHHQCVGEGAQVRASSGRIPRRNCAGEKRRTPTQGGSSRGPDILSCRPQCSTA
jgi:hypothetical protein